MVELFDETSGYRNHWNLPPRTGAWNTRKFVAGGITYSFDTGGSGSNGSILSWSEKGMDFVIRSGFLVSTGTLSVSAGEHSKTFRSRDGYGNGSVDAYGTPYLPVVPPEFYPIVQRAINALWAVSQREWEPEERARQAKWDEELRAKRAAEAAEREQDARDARERDERAMQEFRRRL